MLPLEWDALVVCIPPPWRCGWACCAQGGTTPQRYTPKGVVMGDNPASFLGLLLGSLPYVQGLCCVGSIGQTCGSHSSPASTRTERGCLGASSVRCRFMLWSPFLLWICLIVFTFCIIILCSKELKTYLYWVIVSNLPAMWHSHLRALSSTIILLPPISVIPVLILLHYIFS